MIQKQYMLKIRKITTLYVSVVFCIVILIRPSNLNGAIGYRIKVLGYPPIPV